MIRCDAFITLAGPLPEGGHQRAGQAGAAGAGEDGTIDRTEPRPRRRRPPGLLPGNARTIPGADAQTEQIGEATDGEEALIRELDLRPDVIPMNPNMPKASGISSKRVPTRPS